MQWWPKRDAQPSAPSTATARRRTMASEDIEHIDHVGRDRQGLGVRPRTVGEAGHASADSMSAGVSVKELPSEDSVAAVTVERVRAALDASDVRYLTGADGSLLAMWERHAVLIALEGPADEILMLRARPHATVPRDWADRAYRAVNEWNHSRRFCKAYVGDPNERGALPIYAEVQVPLSAGTHDALLLELLECGVSVSQAFVEWLYGEACLL